MSAPFIAWLKGNPGTSPDLLPVIPLSVGPTPLLPSNEWQTEHCCWKATLPAAACCASAAGTKVPNRNAMVLRRRARFMVSSKGRYRTRIAVAEWENWNLRAEVDGGVSTFTRSIADEMETHRRRKVAARGSTRPGVSRCHSTIKRTNDEEEGTHECRRAEIEAPGAPVHANGPQQGNDQGHRRRHEPHP